MSARRFFAAALALLCLAGALPGRAAGSFTLMVYMCASDLESRDGAATSDLNEMVAAGLTPGAGVRVFVATGGAAHWHTPGITPEQNQYFEVTDVGLNEISRPQTASMCDAAALSDFVSFATVYAPAERYALIMWDHGSGPLTGFGYDERYGGDAMAMGDMADAIERAMGETRLAFIGFDACLMASVECAYALNNAADYMIASQALEPGQGWDYTAVLTALSGAPGATSGALAARLVDGYARATLLADPLGSATMSAVDLTAVAGVADALGALAERLESAMEGDFAALARARHGVKAFGALGGTPSDLVDIVALAGALEGLAPAESAALARATERAVKYARNSPLAPSANGLSVYFPYARSDGADDYLSRYEAGALAPYARFSAAFAREMLEGNHAFADIAPERTSITAHLSNAADAVGEWVDALAGLASGVLGGEVTPAPGVDLWAGLDDVPYAYKATLSVADAAKLSGARGVLSRALADGSHAVHGAFTDAAIDHESGLITCTIDAKILMLNGEPLYLSDRAASLVALNGEGAYLLIDPSDGRVLGVTRGFDAVSGMPVRTLSPLKPGDVVEPVYPRVQDGAPAGYETGAPVTIGEDAPIVEYVPIDPVTYHMSFELTSIYAGVQFTDHANLG